MVNFSMNITEISVMEFQALIINFNAKNLFSCSFQELWVVCGLWNPHSLCLMNVFVFAEIPVVVGPLHAYRKLVRSRDRDKVVGVRKRKQTAYWAFCSVVLSLEHEMCYLSITSLFVSPAIIHLIKSFNLFTPRKNLPNFVYPRAWNSTTNIAIMNMIRHISAFKQNPFTFIFLCLLTDTNDPWGLN